MSSSVRTVRLPTAGRSLLAACIAASLAACGGAAQAPAVARVANVATTDATAVTVVPAPVALSDADRVAMLPTFHMAPAMLAEPDDVDVGGTNVSAHRAPRAFRIEAALSGVDSARLTPQVLSAHIANAARARVAAAPSAGNVPFDNSISAAVFTPAQIRAAYGLSDLPAVGVAVSAALAASLGAGQTIYLVDANDNPNALADLNRFSTKFGLPGCTGLSVKTLPLASPGSACTFSVAYADATGALRAAAPAYDAGWASESALDVQWAHAIAPLARIVLVEANDAMNTSLLGAVTLARRMGPGVVSMSFGGGEGSWVASVDATFTGDGMTFVASTGDNGAEVNWPAVSPNVLAVGGTSLAWSGSGTRREATWSGSGGGISLFEPLPAWQSGVTLPGGAALARRAVADVSFNADPNTGQYVALTAPGSTTTSWNAYGGTSISAPQWAGIVAVANALRASASKARLGDVHSTIYTAIAAVPGTYAAAFGDVLTGANGSCATCKSAAGFDPATGWGTPNSTSLLQLLAGAPLGVPVAVAPVVPGGALSAKAGVVLSQSLGIRAPTGVTTTFSLAGAPTGLSVTTAGVLGWTAPVVGNYAFTATARTSAGMSATGSYTLAVVGNHAPTLAAGSFTTSTMSAFTAKVGGADVDGDVLTYAMTGAPAGLTLSTAGALAWSRPVAGTYALRIIAKDPSGLAATATFALAVTQPVNHAPSLASTTIAVPVGVALTIKVVGVDIDGDALTYSMTGAPAGMTLTPAGALGWPKATRGTFAIKVTARDARGATCTATLTLVVK